ncbi:MAG: hypothetical protein KDD36_00070 [Flavobacteriales bacterium]|nr:hypothetical protein [Flavobacteriales bacterium]
MKKALIILLCGLAAIVLLPSSTNGTCDSKKLNQQCAALMDNFSLVKFFNITDADVKKEYAYMFNKSTTYLINICDENSGDARMIVNIYRGKQLIASSFSQKSKKHYSKIAFPCTATGIYHIKFSFDYGAATCGVVSLGFKNR